MTKKEKDRWDKIEDEYLSIIKKQGEYMTEMRKCLDNVMTENFSLRELGSAYDADYWSQMLGVMLADYTRNHPSKKWKSFSDIPMEAFIFHVGGMPDRNLINIAKVKQKIERLYKKMDRK